MIENVSIKIGKDGLDGCYEVKFDGVPVADKLEILTIFMEPGKIPHMMLSVPFRTLDVDGVNMNVDSYIRKKEEDDDDSGREESDSLSGTPDDCA